MVSFKDKFKQSAEKYTERGYLSDTWTNSRGLENDQFAEIVFLPYDDPVHGTPFIDANYYALKFHRENGSSVSVRFASTTVYGNTHCPLDNIRWQYWRQLKEQEQVLSETDYKTLYKAFMSNMFRFEFLAGIGLKGKVTPNGDFSRKSEWINEGKPTTIRLSPSIGRRVMAPFFIIAENFEYLERQKVSMSDRTIKWDHSPYGFYDMDELAKYVEAVENGTFEQMSDEFKINFVVTPFRIVKTRKTKEFSDYDSSHWADRMYLPIEYAKVILENGIPNIREKLFPTLDMVPSDYTPDKYPTMYPEPGNELLDVQTMILSTAFDAVISGKVAMWNPEWDAYPLIKTENRVTGGGESAMSMTMTPSAAPPPPPPPGNFGMMGNAQPGGVETQSATPVPQPPMPPSPPGGVGPDTSATPQPIASATPQPIASATPQPTAPQPTEPQMAMPSSPPSIGRGMTAKPETPSAPPSGFQKLKEKFGGGDVEEDIDDEIPF